MDSTLRSRAIIHDRNLAHRLDTLVPMLMDRAELDMWIVTAREYNEDPVLETMLPETWIRTARRRTMLVFTRTSDGTVDRMAIARYPVGTSFPRAWDPEAQPDQWGRLAEVIREADPGRIGIDVSNRFPLADGLSESEHAALVAGIGADVADRLVSAEIAAIGWLETRTEAEREWLTEACTIAHGILRRALSSEVIQPGRTTTADVEWWLRQTVHDSGRVAWFHPSCSLQRRGESNSGPADGHADVTIEPGDLVHIDFGLVHHGMHTDQQQHGYVRLPGESGAPDGMAKGIADANRLQDLLMDGFATGRTGNQLLAESLAAARAESIDALVYSHPIGVHGHAAGPTIGLWDQQQGVPDQGDYPIWPDTAYSIELQARTPVPEWEGQLVQFMLEEDAFFDGESCTFVDGRQTELWLI